MLNKPAGNLVGCAAALNAPWSASVFTRMALIFAILVGGNLRRHVVVAGKARGLEILGSALNPFHRHAERQ